MTDEPSSSQSSSQPSGRLRLLLVDDQALIRMGFRMFLDAEPDLRVVGEAADGLQGVQLAASLRPDVVLMDVRMPLMDGITATARITATDPAPKVLILTTFDLDEYVYAGLRSGASGFLLKDVPPAGLTAAIRQVAAGDAVIAPTATRRLLAHFTPRLPDPDSDQKRRQMLDPLTDREQEVLILVGQGMSNREIAQSLHLSEGTVKIHVSHILAKLDLRDRVQVVVAAYETGLIEPGAARKG